MFSFQYGFSEKLDNQLISVPNFRFSPNIVLTGRVVFHYFVFISHQGFHQLFSLLSLLISAERHDIHLVLCLEDF